MPLLMRSLLMTPKLPLTWSRRPLSPLTVLVTLTTPAMLPSLSQLTRQLRWFPPLAICWPPPTLLRTCSTVILEEQALAPARVLARVSYLEHLLGLVQQGCESHQLPAACAPALERAHADLATYLAMPGPLRSGSPGPMHWLTINSWETHGGGP